MEKFLYFFFPGVLESIGIIALSLIFARVPLRWGRVAIYGAILTIIIFIIRALPLVHGIHTLVALLLQVFIINKTTRVDLIKIFISCFVSLIILAFLEMTIHEGFLAITRLDYEFVRSNDFLWIPLGTFQAMLLIGIALLARRFRKPTEGMWKI